MKTKTLKLEDLSQFTGTETWWRHPLSPSIQYTDGAKYVAEHGGAYWLLDDIVIHQMIPKIRKEEFQVWKLTTSGKHTGVLSCEDGNYNEVWRTEIPFTDFPLPEIVLWFENDTIYLPSER